MKALLIMEWAYDCWFSDEPWWYVRTVQVPAPLNPVVGFNSIELLEHLDEKAGLSGGKVQRDG